MKGDFFMKDEKQTITPTPATATNPGQVQVSEKFDPTKWNVVPIPPKHVALDQALALRNAIRDKKSFKLIRKVYQGKNGKYFFGYSVIVMLNNRQKCKEIRLLPDVGFVARGDEIGASKSNSSSFSVLNMMYDFGISCNVIAREDDVTDKFGNTRSVVNFYAVSTDDTGLEQEYPLKPATAGDRALLIGAFTGFGGVRDWEPDDFKMPELKELFAGYCAPGESDKYSNVNNG